jgi:hypothetical protein
MAKRLSSEQWLDVCVAGAPEGHVYGYFFEAFGMPVLTVHVDYPPRRCEVFDDLDGIRGKRTLILEDDVASGTSLRYVVETLQCFQPDSIDLYLGRRKDCQTLDNVDPVVRKLYLAEDLLNPADRETHEAEFIEFFEPLRRPA